MSYLTVNWSFDPFVGRRGRRRRSSTRSVWPTSGDGRCASRTSSPARRSYLFYAGLGMLLLAVMSPIDYWASRYFFVHMIEHILIALLRPHPHRARGTVDPAAPRAAGRAAPPVGRALLLGPWSTPLRAVGRFVTSPGRHSCAFNLVMVVWHVPVLFDAAENNQIIHIWLMHASFFVTGVLFWLTIIPSHPFRIKASPLWQMGAIIGTNVIMFVLAMSLSIFTATSWYSRLRPRSRRHVVPVRRPADRRGHPVGLRGLLGRARPSAYVIRAGDRQRRWLLGRGGPDVPP